MAERIVKNKMYSYLENNRQLSSSQSDFRNFRLMADNFLFIAQKIQKKLKRGKKVCSIYSDKSKSFDKI